jgi:hypothetical protein
MRYALIGVGALLVVLVAVLVTVIVSRRDSKETASATTTTAGAVTPDTKPRPKAVLLQGPPEAVVEGQPMLFTVVATPTDAVTGSILRIDDQEVARSNGYAAQVVWPTAALNPFALTRRAIVELTLEGGDTLVSQPVEVTVTKRALGIPVDPTVNSVLERFGAAMPTNFAEARAMAPNSLGNDDPAGYANVRGYTIVPVRVVGTNGATTTVRAGIIVHEEGNPPNNTRGLPAGYSGKYTRQYCMTIDVFADSGQLDTDNYGAATLVGDSTDWVDPKSVEATLLSSC